MTNVECAGDEVGDRVTVLVCTRNRPHSLRRALLSLLASVGVVLTVVVIDQSDTDATSRVVEAVDDCRVRYHPSTTRGLGAALQEGFGAIDCDFVVRTDDDCEVDPLWVASMVASLKARRGAGLVSCNVVAAPTETAAGYVPTIELPSSRTSRSVLSLARDHGLGAGIAYRRAAVDAIGGFDPALGAGGRFRSCEDWDVQLRMVLAGWSVFHDADLQVTHHGFRPSSEGRRHTYDSWFGIGAMYAKLTRTASPAVLAAAIWKFGCDAVWPPLRDAMHGARPRGMARILGFSRGFLAGLHAPVDRRRMTFAPDAPPRAVAVSESIVSHPVRLSHR